MRRIPCDTICFVSQNTMTNKAGAMDRELKRGSLEMLILALVREADRYGYELVSALDERSDGELSVSGGTLYPVLYRLEEAGHLETRWEAEGRGSPRKYYAITGDGHEELRRRQEELRDEGRYLGIGLGCYAHVTGVGPADVCKEAGI
ncbi:MAG: PadR family transcriptional regulator, partial [Gemmatimonadota bacterium]